MSTPGEILGPKWKLDNYQYIDGSPALPKMGDAYEATFHYDADGDGAAEGTEELPSVDLRFLHMETSATIRVESFPVSVRTGDVDVRVIARELADAASGHSSTSAIHTRERRVELQTTGRTITTSIRGESRCDLGGHPAYRIDLDLADVDQIKLDPGRRLRRVRFIVVRTGFVHQSPGPRRGRGEFPVLLLLGFASRPEDFKTHESDFDQLLTQIGIGVQGSDAPPLPAKLRCDAWTSPEASTISSTASTAALPEGPESGCHYDTQCKGDRVCDNGRCVSPRPVVAPPCQSDANCGVGTTCLNGSCAAPPPVPEK